jgi:alanine racemase
MNCYSFETELARQVDPGMNRSGLKKIEEEKTRQDPVKNPVVTH